MSSSTRTVGRISRSRSTADSTPFEAADTPNLDALARSGRVGTAATTPKGFGAGSDVCTMDLLGYEPGVYHTGRAPLEAESIGIQAGPDDWIFRLNLVTVGKEGTDQAGMMLDHSGGGIPDAEARVLVDGLLAYWRTTVPEIARTIELTHGVGYPSIMVDRSGRSYASVECTPPHEIPDRPWRPAMPSGSKAESDLISELMELSRA